MLPVRIKRFISAKTERIKRASVIVIYKLFNFFHAYSAYAGEGICEIFVYNSLVYTYSLKNLSRLIGLDG